MQNGYKYNIYVRACVCKSHDDCDFTEVTELYVFTVQPETGAAPPADQAIKRSLPFRTASS